MSLLGSIASFGGAALGGWLGGGSGAMAGYSIGSSLFGGGGSSGGGGGGSITQYDPYAPYRSADAAKLQELMGNPSLAMSDPGYAATLQSGINATNRGMAATGQLQSGGEQAALQSLGQNTFSSFYNNKLSNLMQLSGATQSPAAAMSARSGVGLNQARIAQQRQENIAGGVGGLAAIFGGSSSVSPYDNASAWYNSNFNRDPVQADTGFAADIASSFYGPTYNPNAGW